MVRRKFKILSISIFLDNIDNTTDQARSQVLRFRRAKDILWEQDICFFICLIKKFLGTRKFGGHKKLWGGTVSECTPRGYGPATDISVFWPSHDKDRNFLLKEILFTKTKDE